jgi:serine/threonine protein kinase
MYHELKMLLTMTPHPNIIPRPLYLVTQKCRFGGNIGVCGFILEYYPGGNLRDPLPQDIPSLKSLQARLDIARRITSALIHVQEDVPGFYTDLKLPNVLISSDAEGVRALLADF